MTNRPTAKWKVRSLAGLLLFLVFGVWLIWGFNGGSSDEAKYNRLQGLALTCDRLNNMDRWLPLRVSKFIRLHDFKNREKYKHDLLRIELVTSGYLTNATFDITNPAVAMPRITSEFGKAFGAEARISGITIQMLKGYLPRTRELVTITCRSQDLILLGCIVSGDSNAPAKPLQEIPPLFEGDILDRRF